MGTGLCKLEKETRVVCCLFVKVLTLIQQKKKTTKKQKPKEPKTEYGKTEMSVILSLRGRSAGACCQV